MKTHALILLLAASTIAATAQTPAKPATPATAAAKPASTATKSATSTGIKLPPGIPPAKGIIKTAFTASLRYQDIKIGDGTLAEPNKLYKVHYTGYRAADGVKFDSSYDHPRQPVRDKDGKPVLGEDGKPKLGDPQPMPFAQGQGRTIPGFDMGFVGMRVGGKRRLFIPYQLAYGSREIPDHGADHPGIPAKSDLIFDIELVDVSDIPAPPQHGPMGAGMPPHPGAPGAPGAPAHLPPPGAPAAAPAAPAASTAAPAKPAAALAAPATAPATPAAAPSTAAPATPAAPQSK